MTALYTSAVGAFQATRRANWLFLAALVTLAVVPSASAEAPPARDLLIATHVRLGFEKDVERTAVAEEAIATFQLLNAREGLVLGRSLGRTTIMVWFSDGTTESYLFHVRRDLSLLEDALREVHPSIVVRSAPDRDAVVLGGIVPDISYANAAEEMAQRYLDARRGGRRGRRATVRAPGGAPGTGDDPAADQPTLEGLEDVRVSAAVINLIRVESLPGRIEDRMQDAIRRLGVNKVTVSRMVRGRLADDEQDVFVLRGKVGTQTQLIRVLALAQSMLGETSADDIRVRADESGALVEGLAGAGASATRSVFGQGGRLSQLFGGGGAGGGPCATWSMPTSVGPR